VETITLPDGTTIQIPSDTPPEERRRIAEELFAKFQGGSHRLQPGAGPQDTAGNSLDPFLAAPPMSSAQPASGIDSLRAMRRQLHSRPDQQVEGQPDRDIGEGGTLAGSAWEGLKNIPRGARQFGILALAGIEGLRTPDEDTDREKELRQKLKDLQEEIDPRYRDANLAQIGMGLGQYGTMIGASFIPGVGPSVAAGGAMLQMAGDAAGRLAEYEERTGEDVSAGKEVAALGAALGIGLTEMLPIVKYGRSMGLFGKGAREAGEKAAESVVLQTGKQFRASLLPSALRQTVQEGVQEGLSELGMSATAKLLYDEDALANVGSEALREALIGGQVGAIGDVLMKMATRGHGIGKMRYGNYKAGKELDSALTRSIEDGAMDEATIRDLVTGPDLDAIRQRLIDEFNVPETQVEAHPDYQEAVARSQALEAVRAEIMTAEVDADGNPVLDEDNNPVYRSKMEIANEEQAAAERQVNDDRRKDGEIDNLTFKRNEEEINAKATTYAKQIGLLRTAIKMQEQGTLGVEAEVELDRADDLLTEEEIDTEKNILSDAHNGLLGERNKIQNEQKQVDKENPGEAGRAVREDYAAKLGTGTERYGSIVSEIDGIEADLRANEAKRVQIREETEAMDKRGLPEDLTDVAPNVDYGGAELESQIQLALRASQAEVETVATLGTVAEVGRRKQEMDAVAIPLEQKETRLTELERYGPSKKEKAKLARLEKKRNKAEAQLKAIEEDPVIGVMTSLEQVIGDQEGNIPPEFIQDENGNYRFPTKVNDAGSFEYEDGADVLPEYQEAANAYEQFAVDTNALTLAQTAVADAQAEIDAQEFQEVTPEMREAQNLPEEVKWTSPDILTKRQEVVDDRVLLQERRAALDAVNNKKYLTQRLRAAVSKWKKGVDPETGKAVTLQDDIGRLVTPKQRQNLYRFVFDPNDPTTWPPEYDAWMTEARRSQTSALEMAGDGWIWDGEKIVPKGYTVPPKDRRMTAREVRETIDGILDGGVNTVYKNTGKKLRKRGYDGSPESFEGMEDFVLDPEDVGLFETGGGFHVEVPVSRDRASNTERNNARDKISEARNEMFSWWGQLGIAREVDQAGRTKPVPKKYRSLKRLLPSLESLGNQRIEKLVKKLRKNGYNITPDVIVEALQAKNFDVSSAKALFNSPFFKKFVGDTLGYGVQARINWDNLSRGQKESILSRILRTKARPESKKVTQEARVKRRELRRLQDRPGALPKSDQQKAYDLNTLAEARKRFDTFKASAIKHIVAKLGLNPSEILFTADIDSVMSQVEDVVINGAYELEVDADGNVIVEDGVPKVKVDENGEPIYRQAYENGSVASLEKFGTRIVFNLSQIAKKYPDGIDTDPDTLIKDIAAHEGTHLLFLRNDLLPSERRALESYGRKKKVPKEVDAEAHRAGLTWRQWVKGMYPDYTPDMLTEETSVHIIDNLAMDRVPEAQSAGMIGKIKREAIGMFKAIVGASQEGDILPVMRVFEDIQSGAIARRREQVAEAGDLRGAQALWLADRATPKDLKRLKKAMRDGDQAEVDRIADEIVTSRMDLVDDLSPEQRLIESLTSELRARKEIADTPTRVVQSVLNEEAISSGAISAEALNAYFRFRDGRKGAFRIPVGDREKRFGGTQYVPSDADEQTAKDMDYIGENAAKPASSIITALEAHNLMPDGSHIGSGEDARTMMGYYTKRQFLRRKLFDKRLPQWLSSKRTQERGAKLYETALGQLAETSAIAAWRFADNALNFIPGVMKYGMLTYANGGFNMDQLYVKEKNPDTGEWQDKLDSDGEKIKVKSLWDIFKPMIEMGEIGQRITLGYMTALRVRGIHRKRQLARNTMLVAQRGADPSLRPADVTIEEWTEAVQNYGELVQMLQQELKRGETLDIIGGVRREVRSWEDAYNRANKINKKTGERWISEEKWTRHIDKVENTDSAMNSAAMDFAEHYGDFNHYLVEFAHQTGQITRAQADIMQSMPFIPFYRDKGWSNDETFFNPYNEHVEKDNREALEEEEDLRGDLLIDKSIAGSFAPLDADLFGSITRNVNALIRDGMINVAAGRTMRDEIANGTAVEVPTVDRRDYLHREILQKKLAKVKGYPSIDDPPRGELKLELEALEKKIADIEQRAKEVHAELDDRKFSDIHVKVKGVTRNLEYRDRAKIKARLQSERPGQEITEGDIDKALPQEGEFRIDESPSDIEQAGVHKTYRVLDPQLARSVMDIGFSPKQAIEDFFHKNMGLPEGFSAGLSSLLVGASRVLREAVTRSPPFMIKNIIRDGMQATVIYGGGPKMFFKVLKNAIDPNIVERAEQAGLGIGVDWSPDPKDAGEGLVRMLKRDQMKWRDPTDWFVMAWEGLGRFSRRSEVAARMAVYDDVMMKTGNGNIENGNSVEATNQAIEIINYGRRGSSRLFSTLFAMAPFMNGRIQGLDVMYRSHMGRLDAPGLFPGSGGGVFGAITEEQRKNNEWARRATTFGRGSLIMLLTGLYYMMVHDDEEYKNAREDQKNQWWLIPLGGGLPGIKIPIPFEVGVLYKVIPEQIARAYFEDEHDLQDVRNEIRRQLSESLMFDLRPQLIRPVIDALTNTDAYQRDDIVPSWMENTVASTEHYNPYTNRVSRLLADTLDKIPFLQNVDFMTSPMKLEYMMRQYGGTLGSYGMALADRVTRQFFTHDNIVGTQADFGFTARTFANLPVLGDLLYDPQKGGGYQEDFYELIEDVDNLVTTLGQIQENRGRGAGREFKEENKAYFDNKARLRHFEKRMKHYREDRDRLFERRDLSDDDKRRHLYRMFETRDQILDEVLTIMADIRKDRTIAQKLFGGRP
tara:strand:+ start:2615 stop:11041 length:8427 start_codon:yes stop_codon:yes gene_type:complete